MAMVFKSGNRRDNTYFYYNNSALENVISFTYLGVILASNGKFYQTQNTLAEQPTKALFYTK